MLIGLVLLHSPLLTFLIFSPLALSPARAGVCRTSLTKAAKTYGHWDSRNNRGIWGKVLVLCSRFCWLTWIWFCLVWQGISWSPFLRILALPLKTNVPNTAVKTGPTQCCLVPFLGSFPFCNTNSVLGCLRFNMTCFQKSVWYHVLW